MSHIKVSVTQPIDRNLSDFKDYYGGDHRSQDHGWVNVDIALSAARKMVHIIWDKFPNVPEDRLAFVVVDNSSSTLTAYVRLLLPESRLLTCNKYEVYRDRNLNIPEGSVLIMVDDFLCTGKSLEAANKIARKDLDLYLCIGWSGPSSKPIIEELCRDFVCLNRDSD